MKVFEALHGSEQLGLMAALGSYYVWSRMGAPDGLHFRLDLTQPEQRDVAREVVKVRGVACVHVDRCILALDVAVDTWQLAAYAARL